MQFAPLAYGQAGTGEILGTAKDATGAGLHRVELTLTHRESGRVRQVLTETDGSFVAASLPVGEYSIRGEIANFKTQVRDGIVLQVGRSERVDLVLEVGDRREIMIVSESVSPLQNSNAEVGEVIASRRLVDLPLNGRQFVDLTLLSDNVFRSPRGTRGSAMAQTGNAVLVAGQRAGHNMYYLDGVSVTDQYLNHLVASPPVDAIREFNMRRNSAERRRRPSVR
ncbi:MAG TPA: carboxypeptidase-like regulatory domain-containing protein [Rariglobus sp.]